MKTVLFLQGHFVFIRPQALKFISKEIKGIKQCQGKFRSGKGRVSPKVIQMKSAFDQYKHVATERIYSHENNLRL